jgi:hypothetical protein
MPAEQDDGHGHAQADAAARIGEALGEVGAAVAATFAPLVQAAAGLLQALANDPVIRFVMEHPELLRGGQRPQPCHCLCGKAHPGMPGVCEAYKAVTTRRYATTSSGVVDVPLCGPCARAQGTHA